MAVRFRDYYAVLGVPRTATDEEIRREYRNLARKYHPDVNRGDQSAEDKFKEINEAYQVLSDAEKRKKYDALGTSWQAGSEFTPPSESGGGAGTGYGDFSNIFGNGGSATDFSDFFEVLFGARAGRAGAGFPSKGEDLETEIRLSLERAHRGTSERISFRGLEPCLSCGGSGLGDGRRCPACGGSGVGERLRSLDVSIPAGVRAGSLIRLAGQGGPGSNGGPAGDLLLRVRLEPHPLFEVIDSDDLELRLPVAPWEAALGAKVPVSTLDGSVAMTIPAGTRGGQRLRLRGQGLNRRGGARGDLYARITIVNPSRLTAKERDLYEQLAAASDFNAREPMPDAS